MEPLRWCADDLVFLPQVDADHQKLFEQAETVRLKLTLALPGDNVRFDLFRLSKSLSIHLKHEERLMHESRYPGRKWHEEQHQAGRNKMERLLESSKARGGQQVVDAFEEFTSWMRDHVTLADRMFAAHVRNTRRERLAS